MGVIVGLAVGINVGAQDGTGVGAGVGECVGGGVGGVGEGVGEGEGGKWQNVLFLAPSTSVNWPTAQPMHEVEPFLFMYLDFGQIQQPNSSLLKLYLPRGHG